MLKPIAIKILKHRLNGRIPLFKISEKSLTIFYSNFKSETVAKGGIIII